MEGLRSLGFQPTVLTGCPNHVVIDYVVQSGKFCGKEVRLGFIIPPDFPTSSPTGPHVSPHIHPIVGNGNGVHPTGGIHQQHSASFQNKAGGQWQYWSRPYIGWIPGKTPVATYMGHIWRLWDTQ